MLVCNAVSSYLHEHLCTCGTNANENIGVIDCVRFDEDGHTNDMLNTIYGTRLVFQLIDLSVVSFTTIVRRPAQVFQLANSLVLTLVK